MIYCAGSTYQFVIAIAQYKSSFFVFINSFSISKMPSFAVSCILTVFKSSGKDVPLTVAACLRIFIASTIRPLDINQRTDSGKIFGLKNGRIQGLSDVVLKY